MDQIREYLAPELLSLPGAAQRDLPCRTEKPWGHEMLWARGRHYAAKILHIEAGQRLSLQYHRVKDETVMLVRGRMQLVYFADGEPPRSRELVPDQPFHIPPGLRHRMIAIEDTDVLEVSTPELDDVVRLEDRYGRSG